MSGERKLWCMAHCGLVVLSVIGCHAPGERLLPRNESPPHVRMTESSATFTPEFTSAAILTDTSALTWSEDKPVLAVVSNHSVTPLTVSSTIIGAGSSNRRGETELVDRVGQRFLLDQRGELLPSGTRRIGAPLHVAIENSGSWFMVADREGGPILLRFDEANGEPVWSIKLPVPSRVLRAAGGRLRLVPHREGVSVLSSLPPFDVLTYSADGKLIRQLQLGAEPIIQRLINDDGRSTSHNWRLVAGAQLDSLALLTLSDLNSDRRVLALVDPERGVRTSRQLAVPLAVLASDQQWLLAGRRTDQFELVRYEWGWDHTFKEER